jgi:predicted GIY-YIG superfamily endonuclease
MVFERKVLRKIFGPTNENGIWRMKTNQELDKIIKHKNIINFIRAQRLGWLGHSERMQETRMVKAIHLETHFKKANRKTKDTLGG